MEPCRRRAIWAAQAEVTNVVKQEIDHVKDETRKNADDAADALPEALGASHGGRRGNYIQEIPARADIAERKTTRSVKPKANANKSAAKKEMKSCSKCGKKIGRGMYFHEKYCKG